jgi:hypothetical protein
MFAEPPADDDPQATFPELGILYPEPSEEEMKQVEEGIESWLDNLLRQEESGPKPQSSPVPSPSPEEFARAAHEKALDATHKADFKMSPWGHAVVTVGYPKEAGIAQHDTHLSLQHDYKMVLTNTKTIENGEGYHDYELATYLHRDHYDEAVLRDLAHHYR